MGKLKYALVCASNNNRSMAAHELLRDAGMDVSSFGVASRVKIPGLTQDAPNTYEFGTPYATICEDLRRKDEAFYERKGLLQMLERNAKIKRAPQRWQECRNEFDVALTFEERIMNILVHDMGEREEGSMHALLVMNLEVQDTHADADAAAPLALQLCTMLEAAEDWEDEVDSICQTFAEATGRPAPMYTICFY